MSIPQFLSVGKVNIPVTRYAAGDYDDSGRWEDGKCSTFNIIANVQDKLTFQDRQMLEEGDRGRRAIRIYTPIELRFAKQGKGIVGDTVIWLNEVYEVMYAATYRMGVLDHTKAIAVRREQ